MATTSEIPASSSLPGAKREPIAIQDASSWILRIGVVLSVLVMIAGLLLAFVHGGLTVQEMETRPFSTDLGALRRGLGTLDAFALMELGVVLLVLTPVVRVFTAMVLFAVEERDRLYALVTLLVLAMTLGSLLFIK